MTQPEEINPEPNKINPEPKETKKTKAELLEYVYCLENSLIYRDDTIAELLENMKSLEIELANLRFILQVYNTAHFRTTNEQENREQEQR